MNYLGLSRLILLMTIGKLSHCLRVEKDDNGIIQVRLVDRSYIKALANQVRAVLAGDPEGNMNVDQFSKLFQEK